MDSIAPELKEFREELFFLAKNIEYRDKMQPSQFQKQLREDVSKIHNDDKMVHFLCQFLFSERFTGHIELHFIYELLGK